MKPGMHNLELTVRLKEVSVCDESPGGHGKCYQVQLPYRGYASPIYRQVWLEAEEIVGITHGDKKLGTHATHEELTPLEQSVWAAEFVRYRAEIQRALWGDITDDQASKRAADRADDAVALLRKVRK